MSTETWKLEKDLCRCCHSEGLYKNLSEPCSNLGQEEIYSDMMRECFNIDLAPVPGMICTVTYTICDACVLRLRDAFNFKKQVLACELRFADIYSKNMIQVADSNVKIKVKEEVLDEMQDGVKAELSLDEDGTEDDLSDSFQIRLEEDEDSDDALDTIKKRSKIQKTKSKMTPKRMSQRKKLKEESKEATELAEEKKKEPAAPKFKLVDGDYRKDGDTYHCTRCDKHYDRYFSLRDHVKTKHYNIPRYTCPYCTKAFMTVSPLTLHKLEEHNIDERFRCNACKGIFNTKIQLKKHINNFHMLGQLFKCEFCEYETFSFEGLYKHKFKHRTQKDYHCKFCRKSFLRKTTLDLHERIHTGDRRKVCKECGQAFVQKASLNYHMTKYHPEVNF